jgi:hypothetical protein
MKTNTRHRTHVVSVSIQDSPILPVPFAQEGTVMSLTRAEVDWRRLGPEPWRLYVVTVWGAANNGSGVRVDYFPDNPIKQPPPELSEWIASTHPGRVSEESTA